MNKSEMIAAATQFQAERINAVTNMTDGAREKFDALMAKMAAALEAKNAAWFEAIDIKFLDRGDKCIAKAVVRAIGPDCA